MKYLLIIIALILLVGCGTVRSWTIEEKVMLGASCLAVVADAYTTIDNLNNGGWEINPAIGKHPSDGKVIVVMGISQIATTILAHYWPAFRKWGLGIKTGINAGFAFHNTRIK